MWLADATASVLLFETYKVCCAGLDARAAAIVMKSVKNTVRTGRTVVCTIHQPSMSIFRVCFIDPWPVSCLPAPCLSMCVCRVQASSCEWF